MEEKDIEAYIRTAETIADDICNGEKPVSQLVDRQLIGVDTARGIYNELKDLKNVPDDIAFHDSINVDEALRQVHDRIFPHRRKHTLFIYSVAASVLVVLGLAIGGYFWRQQEKAAMQWAYAMPGEEPTSIVTADRQVITLAEHNLVVAGNRLQSCNDGGKKEKLNVRLRQTDDFNKLVVPSSGEHTLTLADGTVVRVNSESELLFPARFASGKRQVKLSGEAFFHVKSNPDQPFVVMLDGISIEVTGTSFNVHAYPGEDEISVALVEGSVRMVQDGELLATLQPQELFTYNRKTHDFQVGTADMAVSTDWMNDVFVFRDEPIGNIIRKLSRWYNVSIEVDDDISQARYTGILSKRQSLAETLDALRLTNELDFKLHRDKKVDILNKKRNQ